MLRNPACGFSKINITWLTHSAGHFKNVCCITRFRGLVLMIAVADEFIGWDSVIPLFFCDCSFLYQPFHQRKCQWLDHFAKHRGASWKRAFNVRLVLNWKSKDHSSVLKNVSKATGTSIRVYIRNLIQPNLLSTILGPIIFLLVHKRFSIVKLFSNFFVFCLDQERSDHSRRLLNVQSRCT